MRTTTGIIAALFGVLLLGGCGAHYYKSEDFAAYWPPPSGQMEEVRLGSKQIMSWESDPRKKTLVGWLEEWKIQPKGVRNKHIEEWDDLFYIFDKTGIKNLGFITKNGMFYRYDRRGRAQRIGEWKLQMTGLKVFFDLPLRSNMDLVPIDPYE